MYFIENDAPPPQIVKQWPLVNEFHIIWYRTVRVVLDNFEHLPLFCVKKAIHNTHVRIQKKFQRGGGGGDPSLYLFRPKEWRLSGLKDKWHKMTFFC